MPSPISSAWIAPLSTSSWWPLIIALVLFTVAALNYPCKGDIIIGPEAMEQVLRRFENSESL